MYFNTREHRNGATYVLSGRSENIECDVEWKSFLCDWKSCAAVRHELFHWLPVLVCRTNSLENWWRWCECIVKGKQKLMWWGFWGQNNPRFSSFYFNDSLTHSHTRTTINSINHLWISIWLQLLWTTSSFRWLLLTHSAQCAWQRSTTWCNFLNLLL